MMVPINKEQKFKDIYPVLKAGSAEQIREVIEYHPNVTDSNKNDALKHFILWLIKFDRLEKIPYLIDDFHEVLAMHDVDRAVTFFISWGVPADAVQVIISAFEKYYPKEEIFKTKVFRGLIKSNDSEYFELLEAYLEDFELDELIGFFDSKYNLRQAKFSKEFVEKLKQVFQMVPGLEERVVTFIPKEMIEVLISPEIAMFILE